MGPSPFTVAVDTNVLLRIAVRDDPAQARAAQDVIAQADSIALSLTCLCEFVWVLRSVYEYSNSDILSALHVLLNTANLVTNLPAVEAALLTLAAGGDFADGVIAYEGRSLGGETFVSFDRKAASALAKQGFATQLLRS